MAILDNSQRSASCVARTDVACLEFNKENFKALVLGNPQIVMNLLKLFCKRIYDQNRQFKIILIKDIYTRMSLPAELPEEKTMTEILSANFLLLQMTLQAGLLFRLIRQKIVLCVLWTAERFRFLKTT